VTASNRLYGYQPGDQGTVLRPMGTDANGISYYLVTTDQHSPAGTIAVFTAEEIEPDSDTRMIRRNRKRLKVGDRVRLTAPCRLAGYHPGDTGVVDAGPITPVHSLKVCYRVRMTKDAPGLLMAFLADEIEPDG
jgi:hypothetical protein